MALANYAAVSDVQLYLKNVNIAAESNALTALLNAASRAIDGICDRFFYADGAATKWFDGDGTAILNVPSWAGDFYSLTALKILTTENLDPTVSANFIAVSGDGITPPSNFWLEPANQPYVGQAGSSLKRPFNKIVLPVSPNANDGVNYISAFTKGRRTVGITASWGWPAVPDEIKDVCAKVAVRMWQARGTGWTGAIGDPQDMGRMSIVHFLDVNDLNTLHRYRRWSF